MQVVNPAQVVHGSSSHLHRERSLSALGDAVLKLCRRGKFFVGFLDSVHDDADSYDYRQPQRLYSVLH